MLRNELLRGVNRLAGAKVLIWEFAMRELCDGDWKLIELPAATPLAPPARAAPPNVPATPSTPSTPASRGKFIDLASGRSVVVTGTVAAASGPPRANSPYKDFLMQFHLVDVRASDGRTLDGDQALVLVLTMKDRRILPPAHLKPGQKATFRLVAWGDAARKYDALRRSELEGDLLLEPLCFGEYQP